LSEQTLHNWVKAAGNGGLKSSATPIVSAEQMEISRLRTELSRVKMERDILKNHRGPQFRLWAEKRLALPWTVEGSGRRFCQISSSSKLGSGSGLYVV